MLKGEWKYTAHCKKCSGYGHWIELRDIGCNICSPVGIAKFTGNPYYQITGEVSDIRR